jgi:hypothetical protein
MKLIKHALMTIVESIVGTTAFFLAALLLLAVCYTVLGI